MFSWSMYGINYLQENDCNTTWVFTDRGMCVRHPDIKNKSGLASIIKC